jgi:monoamine oxidase
LQPDEATTTGRWTDRLVGLQRVDLCRSVGGLGLPDAVATWIRLTVEAETGVEWDRIAALDGVDDLRPFLVDEDGRARDRSFSVAGGNERLIAELVDRLPSGTVLTGATVRQVVDDGDGVHVTYRLGSGAERCERGRWAVLTAPVWTLREIDIRPALSPEAQAAIMSTASGSYVKVVLRLARGAEQLWDRYDGRLFTLLSDALPGCVYVRDGRSAGCDHVLTALVHGAYARGLHELPDHLIVSSVVSGLQSLRERVRGSTLDVPILPGLSEWITEARVVDCPRAIAYWPQALRRSRFDHLAESLRRPHGRVLIGGDSTECSHSDGAARAALRLARSIAERSGSPDRSDDAFANVRVG